MSPDVDRHPLEKNGTEEKTGVRGVSAGRQEPQHLVHEARNQPVEGRHNIILSYLIVLYFSDSEFHNLNHLGMKNTCF